MVLNNNYIGIRSFLLVILLFISTVYVWAEISDPINGLDTKEYGQFNSTNGPHNGSEDKLSGSEAHFSQGLDSERVMINKPVKWKKRIKFNSPGKEIKINLTTGAKNITVKKIENEQIKIIPETKIRVNESGIIKELSEYQKHNNPAIITGKAISTENPVISALVKILRWLLDNTVTGYYVYETEVQTQTADKEKAGDKSGPTQIIIDEDVKELEVEYITKGPVTSEKNLTKNIKQVTVSSDIHYLDILAYTTLSREVSFGQVKLYWLVNNTKLEVSVDQYDKNDNGLVDYIEWVVPHLSSQIYEVVLDSKNSFDQGVYNNTDYNNSKVIINHTGDNYTKLLLHFNGEDNSADDSDFIDSGGKEHEITQEGNAKLENTQSKFGETSAYFDGSGDYLSIPDSNDWNLGSEDFTIDAWVYKTVSAYSGIVSQTLSTGSATNWIFGAISSATTFGFYNNNAVVISSNTEVPLNQWVHLAVVRKGDDWYLFYNGNLDKKSTSSAAVSDSSYPLTVGAYWNAAGQGRPYTGYIDELRISKGIARWNETFTPPQREYSTGSYTSKIFDTNYTVEYKNISMYTTQPYGELPSNMENEEAEIDGGINMTGNVLLLHLNDGPDGITQSLDYNREGTWDTVQVRDPSILKDENGNYHMWSTAYDGTTFRTIYANSTNGTTWNTPVQSLDKNSEGIWDTDYAYFPEVLKDENGIYHMWYTGRDSTNLRILYTNSTDGINWVTPVQSMDINQEGNWDTVYAYSPSVLKDENGIYHMWYTGANGAGYRILYTNSTNGINWETPVQSLDINQEGTWDTSHITVATVIKDGDIYKMWFTAKDGINWRILYSTSEDKIHWETPVRALDKNSEGNWDTIHITGASVIKDGNSYRMWYTGSDSSNQRILHTKINFIDESGHGNDGMSWNYSETLPQKISGKINDAYNFDGDKDYIVVRNSEELNITSQITLSAWIYPVKWTGLDVLIRKDSSYALYNFEDNLNLFLWGPNHRLNYHTKYLNKSKWYHVASTYDGSTMRMYVDGIEVNSTTTSGSIAATDNPVYIGMISDTWHFNGSIDEVAIWNRSLSEEEILNIYKRGALKLNLSVRSCDDSECSGETWTDIEDTSYQNLTIADNRYFQYKTEFETDNSLYTPELLNLSFNYYFSSVPHVELNFPIDKNNSIDLSAALFNCSASTPQDLIQNITLYLDYNGSWKRVQTKQTSSKNLSIDFTRNIYSDIGKLTTSEFKWNCLACDSSNDCVFADNNFTLSNWNKGNYSNSTKLNTSEIILEDNDERQELPNNQNTEWFNMSDNVLLMHFNNDSRYGETTEGSSNNTYDFSGNGNNGTIYGATFNKTGKLNGSMYFDGNDYINLANSASLKLGTSDFTISTWINLDSLTGEEFKIFISSYVDSGNRWYLGYKTTENHLYFKGRGGGADLVTLVSDSGIVSQDKWHHVTLTVNNSNPDDSKLYLDGIEVTNGTYYATPGTNLDNNADVRVGHYENTLFYFDGKIDEISMWKKYMSAEEIKEIYDMQKGIYRSKGEYVSEIFSSENLLSFDNISWDEEVPYGEELPNNMENEGTEVNGGINMSGNILLLHFNNDSSYGETTEGPSNNTYDFSGNGNNGTIYGAKFNKTGKLNGAFEFDGIDDYINIDYNNIFDITDEITMSIWIQPHKNYDSSISHIGLIGKYDGSGDGQGFGLEYDGGEIKGLFLPNYSIKYKTNLIKNQWYHIIVKSDNTNKYIYLNGKKVNSTPSGTFENYVRNLTIGSLWPNNYFFNGSIDEVAIWNRSLSEEEILNIYKRGVLRLNLSVRSCDDPECSGETWIDIADNKTLQPLSVSNNKYFQYKTEFQTDDANLTPEISRNTVNITFEELINYNLTKLINDTNGEKTTTGYGYLGGTLNRTSWDKTTNALKLISENINGTYISEIFDAGLNVTWSNLTWKSNITQQINSETKLLLHFNGEDNTQSTSDDSPQNHDVSFVSNAHIETDNYQFGNSSLYLDGVEDKLNISDSSDWYFGSGDFTVDFWMYISSHNTYYDSLVCQGPNFGSSWCITYRTHDSHGIFFRGNGFTLSTGTSGWNTGEWYHVAVVRENNDFMIYRDGKEIAKDTSTVDLTDVSEPLYVGYDSYPYGYSTDFNGYIDELRITKGTALWDSNFTVPDKEAYNSNISIQTRESQDNISWSEWSEKLSNPSGELNNSARFIQYKAFLETENPSSSPYLFEVNLTYKNSTSHLINYNLTKIINLTDGGKIVTDHSYIGGILNRTIWSGQENGLTLSSSEKNGTYLSEIFDAGLNVTWSNITWSSPSIEQIFDLDSLNNITSNNFSINGDNLNYSIDESTFKEGSASLKIDVGEKYGLNEYLYGKLNDTDLKNKSYLSLYIRSNFTGNLFSWNIWDDSKTGLDAFTASLGTDHNTPRTYRQLIDSSSISTSGDQFRISTKSHTTIESNYDKWSICERLGSTQNCVNGTWKPITFNNSRNKSIPAGNNIAYSDWIDYEIDSSKNYFLTFYLSSGLKYTTAGPGAYYSGSDLSDTQDWGSSGAWIAPRTYGVSSLQVRNIAKKEIKVDSINKWQRIDWDISELPDSDIESIDRMSFRVINDSSFTAYIDDVSSEYGLLNISTRTSYDNITWSGWGEKLSNPSGEVNSSARFIQYNAYFETKNETYPPLLNEINLSYKEEAVLELTMCSPTINQNWIITDNQTCDAVEADVGTGSIIINEDGRLRVINNANVTASGIQLNNTGDRIFIRNNSRIRII